MGKCYLTIDKSVQQWIEQQQMFFVATAPLGASGSINLSPKGHDSLRILDEHTLAYMDSGGSGIETVAHLRENQRIVIMMCAYDSPPKIMRFHGLGEVITPLDDDFSSLVRHFDRRQLGIRNIIKINVTRISDSCGFGVPLYDYQGQRTTSVDYVRTRSGDQIRTYLKQKNPLSIDGLPGISADEADAFVHPNDK